METNADITADRVRKSTSDKKNAEIDKQIEQNIRLYSNMNTKEIKARIKELDKEWDIERAIELNASLIGLAGIILAATVNKKWLILPAVVTGFLAQHAIQGWCPPVPLFRSMNIRTRKEIDKEKYSLLEVLKNKPDLPF
jgi:predicted DNA-binding transcriptional regulator